LLGCVAAGAPPPKRRSRVAALGATIQGNGATGGPVGALEKYLSDLRDIKLSGEGVSELSYYPALARLLEEIGGGLKPKVRCVMNLKNEGAGLPDGGLFAADQVRKGTLGGQKPARGAIEVKGMGDDIGAIAHSEQVLRYLEGYRQMLVTNLREFLLLGVDDKGAPVTLERYSLAPSEAEFWAAADHPRRTDQEQGERFTEFLKRVMLSGATLAAPQDLAWFLASYAREARILTESAELPALDAVRKSLEDTLGVKFEGPKGEHFFRSTLVQTLFYGLFASWVMWSHDHEPGDGARFEWRQAAWTLHVPVVQALFTQIATPHLLGSLGLVPVLERAAAALDRVDRDAFFKRFEQHHAVQYFYEPFLEAFDPALRKELGVWYTPPEIVEYMVARVDTVLREELDVPDGLADPRVYVLDPCCGTGAYLVEVLERISQTLDEKGADALSAGQVKKAALERVFGFEILPAPFVIAHMQLGLMLQNMALPLAEHERVGVYLTNALTGWESPHKHEQLSALPELEAERDAAEHVKQELPILVILGNPPYNGFAGVSPEEEHGLVEVYKKGLSSEWGITKNYLDDLYVRFFSLAERRIAEMTGRGVICYISNFSYLSDPSSVVLRRRLLERFGRIWIDCLNGDSRETGKKTPEGLPDPSVFSTPGNREGIQVGTAVLTLARNDPPSTDTLVRFRSIWGASKRENLLSSLLLATDFNSAYESLAPHAHNRYLLRPWQSEEAYRLWPSIVELAATDWLLGLNENRGGALVDETRDDLAERLGAYFDRAVSFENLPSSVGGLKRSWARFDPARARETLLTHGLDETKLVRFIAKPFDLKWAYVDTRAKLWNESRPSLVHHASKGNQFIMARARAPRANDGAAFYVSRSLADQHALHKDAYLVPMVQIPNHSEQIDLLATPPVPQANLSDGASLYLDRLGIELEAGPVAQAEAVWMHVLAIGYSPAYLTENADGIRLDWPRVPLPKKKELLEASAELGRRVADLLDPEADVAGVTGGSVRAELKVIGRASHVSGPTHPLNPDKGDLAVTAGWGHAGQGGVTMPGKGKSILRPYAPEERAAIEQGAEALGLSAAEAFAQLGDQAVDVYLNDLAYWRCVPAGVWSYTIGGYQVMKKWLSYREKALLGRDLGPDEVEEVKRMARRIAAILLLQPALDANYLAVKEHTYPWGMEKG
jgi:hypothetical protein